MQKLTVSIRVAYEVIKTAKNPHVTAWTNVHYMIKQQLAVASAVADTNDSAVILLFIPSLGVSELSFSLFFIFLLDGVFKEKLSDKVEPSELDFGWLQHLIVKVKHSLM